MAPLSLTTTVTLNTKTTMPLLGFGVWDSPKDITTKSCLRALEVGYRHIDTAQAYGNEAEVGKAIAASSLPRDQIFATSKIVHPPEGGDVDATYDKILQSVKLIGGEDGYLDLMLIHNQACGKEKIRVMWQAMEKLHQEGKIKAIGVSNFGIGTIEEMKAYATVWPPAVNQLELHPYNQQPAISTYCTAHNIALQAYCPLVRNLKASDPVLTSLATKHSTTTQQVLLRYCLQKGWSPLPKSDNPGRIAQNADLYGFELDAGDIGRLDALEEEAGRTALVVAVDDEPVK